MPSSSTSSTKCLLTATYTPTLGSAAATQEDFSVSSISTHPAYQVGTWTRSPTIVSPSPTVTAP